MPNRLALRRLLVVLSILCLLGIAVFGIVATTVIRGFGGTAGDVSALNHSGRSGSGQVCGLVFGAAVRRNARPGPGIARRIATAARLYKQGVLQHIIVSGGKGEGMDASEAEVMRTTAIEEGIPATAITLEGESRSTWENLLFSRPLTGSCATVIAISDRYHLARITYLARAQGWEDVRTLPSDRSAPWYFEIRSIGREVAAIIYYALLTTFVPLHMIPTHTVAVIYGNPVLGFMINKTVHLDLSIAYSR